MLARWKLVLLAVAALLVVSEDEASSSEVELPTTCRECGENERTYNTFRCPECHSEMTADDHPPLATEYEGGDD